MKVLFLDGNPLSTTFIPLHISRDHECTSENVITPELTTLQQKYGSWIDIPPEDLDVCSVTAMNKIEDLILNTDPQVIVATSYACALLSGLILDCTWKGKSVMINPQGHTLGTGGCDDIGLDFDCTWIITPDSDCQEAEGLPHYENCVQVLLPTPHIDTVNDTGILTGILSVHHT